MLLKVLIFFCQYIQLLEFRKMLKTMLRYVYVYVSYSLSYPSTIKMYAILSMILFLYIYTDIFPSDISNVYDAGIQSVGCMVLILDGDSDHVAHT